MRAMQFSKISALSAFVAGFVAVLVGFTSSVAIVFQAAQSLAPRQRKSRRGSGHWVWAWALPLVPSLLLRKPVMVAWSTRALPCSLPPGLRADSPWARQWVRSWCVRW